jgi:membrane protease YdiL (CAAX protease family)
LGKNPLGLWQLSAGFLLVAGLLLPMSASLVAIGWFKMHLPEGLGLGPILLRTLPLALLTAWVVELFFRGVVMGVFLRAMRPAAALGMSAAFFAMIASVIPPEGLNVVDPESGSVGFEMLRLLGQRFADGSEILQSFVPFLALGLVLAYARWRTASLWLPIGMHAGWLTAKKILSGMIAVNPGALPADGVSLVQHMILPLVALAITGLLAHYMTENPKHPDAPRS